MEFTVALGLLLCEHCAKCKVQWQSCRVTEKRAEHLSTPHLNPHSLTRSISSCKRSPSLHGASPSSPWASIIGGDCAGNRGRLMQHRTMFAISIWEVEMMWLEVMRARGAQPWHLPCWLGNPLSVRRDRRCKPGLRRGTRGEWIGGC